jgi:signal peptidase II
VKRRAAVAVVLVLLVLDQITKEWARRALPLHGAIDVFPFFNLVHVRNTGAAFGILPQSNALFIGVTLVILAVLAKMGREFAAQGVWARSGLPFVWAGALGNLVDRLRHGAVIDFLDFHWRGWHWPAFNVADSAITVGIGCLIVQHFAPRLGRE